MGLGHQAEPSGPEYRSSHRSAAFSYFATRLPLSWTNGSVSMLKGKDNCRLPCDGQDRQVPPPEHRCPGGTTTLRPGNPRRRGGHDGCHVRPSIHSMPSSSLGTRRRT